MIPEIGHFALVLAFAIAICLAAVRAKVRRPAHDVITPPPALEPTLTWHLVFCIFSFSLIQKKKFFFFSERQGVCRIVAARVERLGRRKSQKSQPWCYVTVPLNPLPPYVTPT